jgi:hypothetical protein
VGDFRQIDNRRRRRLPTAVANAKLVRREMEIPDNKVASGYQALYHNTRATGLVEGGIGAP